LQDYDRIKGFLIDMGIKYLDLSEKEIYEHWKSKLPADNILRPDGRKQPIILLYDNQK
jgi:hypothetical protein